MAQPDRPASVTAARSGSSAVLETMLMGFSLNERKVPATTARRAAAHWRNGFDGAIRLKTSDGERSPRACPGKIGRM
ncbi:hypothetical protein TUM18999_25810 [Pseudomonas tohonis]|uniref:Uncharacterized protein n=1 Tax=Pseudomonas tohonis TaxID=2725477 RepID=A0A6J4E457_9PSED|nr:hypothetical protein TUM18999_25810 [Pseudomonas tohonis]GJN52252.1 hypothetical protein TUM20286_20040 [Pseudomonas tohonis]